MGNAPVIGAFVTAAAALFGLTMQLRRDSQIRWSSDRCKAIVKFLNAVWGEATATPSTLAGITKVYCALAEIRILATSNELAAAAEEVFELLRPLELPDGKVDLNALQQSCDRLVAIANIDLKMRPIRRSSADQLRMRALTSAHDVAPPAQSRPRSGEQAPAEIS